VIRRWTLPLCHMWVLSFKKLGGEVDGRIEGIVAGLSRLMMGIPPTQKKGGGCLSASFRSESSSRGRAISYPWRAIFRGCIMQGRKTAKGSKNRIENRSHHHIEGEKWREVRELRRYALLRRMQGPTMTRTALAGSNERERESDMGVCFFLLFIFMEFTTQGGAFQVLLIRVLLRTSPKRIKRITYCIENR
jgi:hypothetical protein